MTESSTEPLLLAETHDHVRVLRLNRPEKRNPLSTEMGWALVGGVADAAADPDVRVVAITGSGGSFCAGADLSPRQPTDPPPASMEETGDMVVQLVRGMRIECTKPVLGLKFFMVLAAMGEEGMANYIEQQFDLTAHTFDFLQGLEDFECLVKPECNILCFRVRGIPPEDHLVLRDRLLARGNYYVSTTSLNGQRYLRLTLTNPATSLDEIEGLVHEIRELV